LVAAGSKGTSKNSNVPVGVNDAIAAVIRIYKSAMAFVTASKAGADPVLCAALKRIEGILNGKRPGVALEEFSKLVGTAHRNLWRGSWKRAQMNCFALAAELALGPEFVTIPKKVSFRN